MIAAEARLLRDAAQMCINTRAIHDQAMAANLPMLECCATAHAKVTARDNLYHLIRMYLRYIAHHPPMQNATPNARPRTP